MDAESRSEELLAIWRRLRAEGREASPAEVCRDCPELALELARRIRALEAEDERARRLNFSERPTDRSPPPAEPLSVGAETPAKEVKQPIDGAGRPTGEYLPQAPPPDRNDPPPQTAERFLGRYRVEALLGRGGYGEVWRAYDPLLLREVAIKTPRHDRPLPADLRRSILEEARKLAALRHPNIVPVHDVFEDGNAVLIVSGLIEGSSLAHYAAGRRLPARESLSIVTAVAEALHHAHLHGVVHRDVKPGNILVDRQGHAHLADFGLAVSEEELLLEKPSIRGTLAYMSPEQVRGDSHLVDARTDVYSLGVVLYELLTGRLPFKAANLIDYREQILHRLPRPLRTIDDAIAPELEQVCLKCLAKSAAERYTTAADLARDVRRWLDREGGAPRAHRVWRWWGTGLALGIICLMVGLLIASRPWQATPTPQDTARATVPGSAPPQPGVWQDLLVEEPTVLLRPERFARQLDPVKKELWWDTQGDCMIRLGVAHADDYEVEATFEQPRIAEQRGLFFGHPPEAAERPNVTQSEVFLVVPDPLRKRDALMVRTVAVVNEAASRVDQLRPVGPHAGLSLRSPSQFTLSVRVREGRFEWVRFDHTAVEGLDLGAPPIRPGLIGEFGVFMDRGGARLTKARWKTYK